MCGWRLENMEDKFSKKNIYMEDKLWKLNF